MTGDNNARATSTTEVTVLDQETADGELTVRPGPRAGAPRRAAASGPVGP
jgi:hypothetical protein